MKCEAGIEDCIYKDVGCNECVMRKRRIHYKSIDKICKGYIEAKGKKYVIKGFEVATGEFIVEEIKYE